MNKYDRLFKIESCRYLSPTHLLVTGTVLNTGTATWQKDNLENEFRLRLRIIRRDTGDFLKELRWVFPGRDISPNQFEDFRFIIDSRDIDNNSSLIDLDVIKENHFSFVDFSLPPARFNFPRLEILRNSTTIKSRSFLSHKSQLESIFFKAISKIAPILI